MYEVKALVLSDVPVFPTWAHPAVYYSGSDLYICFEAHEDDVFSVICLTGLIEYRVQPLTDESIWKHQYFSAGLESYKFHLMENSPLTKPWPNSQHWAITFKDEIHDVVASSLTVISRELRAPSKEKALLTSMKPEAASVS
ncbi:hypothetical protein [Pseudomonas sp. FP1740]|uniref:hypothetical protein n=1 Tax=Pseudomonas sp. FP1740 TaxID=2954078 RepID=UPI00273230D2|nr:hypothetical protein [Pseudomonas sp. FP1740]WLG46962.1 hypothetical protein PSH69_10285 [Pseudomonas sp. FP1740]